MVGEYCRRFLRKGGSRENFAAFEDREDALAAVRSFELV